MMYLPSSLSCHPLSMLVNPLRIAAPTAWHRAFIHSMLAAEPGPVHLIVVTSAKERLEIITWFDSCSRPPSGWLV